MMKKTQITILVTGIMLIINNLSAQVEVDTFQTTKRKIVVSEYGNEVKVKVSNKNDTTELKTIYEGTFIDGKESEKYFVREAFDWSLDLFSKKKKKSKMSHPNPHWTGCGWGFTTVTDGSKFNDIEGIDIKESSNEFFVNMYEIPFSLYKNNIMIYTGFGMSWKNFKLDGNTYFVEKDGITLVAPAPVGISYEKSRLRVFSLNIPLALELQSRGRRHLFVSAGVVAGLNVFRSQKIIYKDVNGNKIKHHDKDLNVSRLSLEFMVQVGIHDFGIFVKYSPLSLFEDEKGPDVQTASLGILFGI